MTIDKRALMAASNNADLHEIMFHSHGVGYTRTPLALVAHVAPPPFYVHVDVVSAADGEEFRGLVGEARERFQAMVIVKDSFCQLDGFDVLFGASWIWRAPQVEVMPRGWALISDETALIAWETAWKAAGSDTPRRMFGADLLGREDLAFVGCFVAGAIVAGCIANKSDDCVGISNVFSCRDNVFGLAASAVGALNPNVPIVGYEAGDDLGFACDAGFEVVGDLRILRI